MQDEVPALPLFAFNSPVAPQNETVDEPASSPVLAGSRCALRVLTVEDAVAWHAGEDEEQRRWFEFPGPAPFDNVVKAIEAWRGAWVSGGPVRQWGIWEGDVLAGGVEIRVRKDGRANVSYVVFPPHRRRGLRLRQFSWRLRGPSISFPFPPSSASSMS